MRLLSLAAWNVPVREKDSLDAIGRQKVLRANRLTQEQVVIEVKEDRAQAANAMQIQFDGVRIEGGEGAGILEYLGVSNYAKFGAI